MITSFSESPETAQSLIDAEISHHKQRLLDLKVSRNAHARVSKLPEEVLLKIFMICREECPMNIKRWHHITHVCHNWRRVALEAPLLWVQPPTDNHSYLPEILARSKAASLHIEIISFSNKIRNFDAIADNFDAIAQRIARIQILNVELTSKTVNILLAALHRTYSSGVKASKLEDLKLSLLIRNSSDRRAGHTLSSALFDKPNQLRQVSLSNIRFDWKLLISSPNLTHLHLEHHRTATKNTDAGTIVSTLGEISHLEKLYISCLNVDLAQQTDGLHPRTLRLCSLQSLTIADSDLAKAHFLLSGLHFPFLSDLEVDCSSKHTDANDSDNLSATVRAVLATLSNGNFKKFSYLILRDESVTSGDNNFLLKVRKWHAPSMLAQFMNGIDQSQLVKVKLYWESRSSLSSDSLVKVIGNLPHLTTIMALDRVAAAKLTAALRKSSTSFCALSLIIWAQVRLDPDALSKSISNLYDYLLGRKQLRGAPIPHFQLAYCSDLSDDMVKKFADIGVDTTVVIDGSDDYFYL